MNKKIYRGYELIKAIHDGEIKDGAIIEVHDLSTLDHVKARITFRNKKLNWISGEFDTSCLFDDNIYFRVLEDNTKIKTGDKVRVRNTTVPKGYNFTYNFGIGSIGKVINVTNYTNYGRNVIVQFENDINKQEWFYEDDLEILEDNTEEIEELDNWFVDERKECREFDIQAINLCFSKHRDKINELVEAINSIRKEKTNNG